MGPQEDYIETVFTCEGDYDDPHLQDRLEDFKKSLKDLLLTDKSKLILKKVEPWNSVRVTFNIPREAAVRLKQLAQQGNTRLKDLGVLAVQIQNQHISLTIAGRNNEHAQLVFRTAEPSASNMPTVSIFDTNSSSLDEIGPQGPGPSYVETTSKNIADYLRQGLGLDALLNPPGDKSYPPGATGNGNKGKRNNIIQPSLDHGSGKHTSFQPPPLPTSHHGHPSRSPSVNATSPRRSPVGQAGLEFPQLTGMPPVLPPGQPQGQRHSLDNLPPPPPYPQGSSIVNNLQQKLRFATDTNPLLVNLLHQHDPHFSNLLQAGLLPPGMDESLQQPPKKKRKPRKPKEKKKSADIEMPVTSSVVLSSAVASLPIPASLPCSVATLPSSLTTTSFVNRDVVASVKEHSVRSTPQAGHNMIFKHNPEHILPLTIPTGMKRPEDSDTAGKIINPVTGLLEPIDNLSDTSPTKSESGKQISPRSRVQKTNTGEVIFSSPSKVEGVLSHQGKPSSLHPSIQRTLSEHSVAVNAASLGLSHRALNSSHPGVGVSSDMLQHKQFTEALKTDFMAKSQVKNDIMPPDNKLKQKLHDGLVEHPRLIENECDKLSAPGVTNLKLEPGNIVGLPQESDIKSIPPELLNKPLLQVKHTDGTGGKPSGSPDSNGDSECSSQSISLDTQNGADLGSQAGQPLDPRSYNNDSGVGSSSERSDDTPSEPGDSDFKSGNASSFECAKTPVLDPLKLTPPSSKIVTVGFALNDTHKNHKIVSPFISSDKNLNSKFDLTKLKSEKAELCSPSQLHGLSWTSTEDQVRGTNIVDSYVKAVVQESINRKSPKLGSVGLNARLPIIDGQAHSMQGIPEQSMQKKKSSPRNSPRGSPRNPSSPRNANSPRGAGSPRSTDSIVSGNSRQSYLTAQEFAAHLPPRESHNKSPYSDPGKSPHIDQRKSPFNFLLAPHTTSISTKTIPSGAHLLGGNVRHDLQQRVSMDTLRLSPQCNIDNIALLKSLEAAHGPFGLPGKEASILQKFEELRPYFQKLQQQAAQASSATLPVRNGTDVINHLARSPGSHGPLNKLGPPPSMDDLHSAFEMSVPNNLHPSVTSSMSSDRENSMVNCVNSKGNKEENKGANHTAGTRRSPGAATSNSVSSYPNDSSLLPPPKRLTESVQKLFPNPLDNLLPHDNITNRRSPISSASVTRVNTTTSVSVASPRGSLPSVSVRSSGNKTPVSDFDLDSITPSISGFGFGPMDFQFDTSLKSQIGLCLPDSVTMPKLMMMDSNSSHFSHQSIVSTQSVKVVPSVLGSITSHKAYVGDSLPRSSTLSSQPVSSNGGYSISSVGSGTTSVSSANSDTKTSMCNSDSKMANVRVSTAESFLKSHGNAHGNSPTYGPPLLHPQNVKYPKSVEKPKSPYQQMGLSEMLQETANLQSISAGRAASPVSNLSLNQRVSQHMTVNKLSDQDKNIVSSASFVEKIQMAIDTKSSEHNTVSEPRLSNSVSNCVSQENSQNAVHGAENSDIPKLKCQINVGSTGTSWKNETSNGDRNSGKDVVEKNCQHITKSTESPNTFSNKDPSPPVLTAVVTMAEDGKENLSKEPGQSDQGQSKDLIITSSAASTHVPFGENDTQALGNDLGTNTTVSNFVTQLSSLPVVTDHVNQASETVNSVGEEHENSGLNLRTSKLRKRRESSESIEEKPEDSGVALRQLRSRKRTNTGENENVAEDSKRLKLDLNSDVPVSVKSDSAKEGKAAHSVKNAVQDNVNVTLDPKSGDETNTQESLVKGGVRTRTNFKSVTADEKSKPPSGRESRKDGKVISNKPIPDKKLEPSKADEAKRTQQSRRNRQSPSAPADKLITNAAPRDKSPLRVSRTRSLVSPVGGENSEESQENKRTTRSAKTKAEPVAQTSSKSVSVNKRRRTSQDHR